MMKYIETNTTKNGTDHTMRKTYLEPSQSLRNDDFLLLNQKYSIATITT